MVFKPIDEMASAAAYIYGRMSVVVENWDEMEAKHPDYHKEAIASIFRDLHDAIYQPDVAVMQFTPDTPAEELHDFIADALGGEQ